MAFNQLHFLFPSVWQSVIFIGWFCISIWCPLMFSTALSCFLTWLNTFLLFMKCILIFLFAIFLNLIEFLFMINLHFFANPSQREWSFMKSHVFCVFWYSIFLSSWWEFLHSILFIFLLVEVFSSLIIFFFFPSQFNAFSKSYLSLMDFLLS